MREENLKKLMFFTLIVIVLVLSIILIYLLVVKPEINKRNQGIYSAGVYNGQVGLMNYMLTQLKQKGIVTLRISNNTSINLIQYSPKSSSRIANGSGK